MLPDSTFVPHFSQRDTNIYSRLVRGVFKSRLVDWHLSSKTIKPIKSNQITRDPRRGPISQYDITLTLCKAGRNRTSALSLPDVLDGWRTPIRPAVQGHGRPHASVPFQPTLRSRRSL